MKRVARFALNLGLYAAIVVGVLFGLPRFLSWSLETPYPMAAITSGSMWPILNQGDLVLIEGVAKEDIKVGDVIVWKNPQGFTIHRVVRLGEDTLVTKGDANFTEDEPVRYDDVIGRTYQLFGKNVRFPYLGIISAYARKNIP